MDSGPGLVADLRDCLAVCDSETPRAMGLHPKRSINACGEWHDYHAYAVRPIFRAALAGTVASCSWLSVFSLDVSNLCADLSPPVRAHWAARCRTADNRVALHNLACRFPAGGDRLYTAARARTDPASSVGDRRGQHWHPGSCLRRHITRDCRPCAAPCHYERRQ